MKSSDLFIDAYNSIDNYLKKEGNYESHVSFMHKIKHSKNNIIRNHRDDLITYGELRNAIVHSPRLNDKAIAEPHAETVNRLQKIRDFVLNPKKVYPTFNYKVIGAREDESINGILKEMRELSFSQFPVYNYDMTIKELITSNTIARWLSSNMETDGSIIVDDVKVSELIAEVENKNNYKFISRDSTIFDAYDLFIEQTKKNGCNLDAIFITHSGNVDEKVIGLITIEDITVEIKKHNKS